MIHIYCYVCALAFSHSDADARLAPKHIHAHTNTHIQQQTYSTTYQVLGGRIFVYLEFAHIHRINAIRICTHAHRITNTAEWRPCLPPCHWILYPSAQITHCLLRSTEASTELNGCQLTAVTATLRAKKPPYLRGGTSASVQA